MSFVAQPIFSIGQEVVSMAMAAVVDAKGGDTDTCACRGHGHALALGLTFRSMMAEMMGKEAGCC
jgi:2-oxoisovalerate dehydrogenase E1 component